MMRRLATILLLIVVLLQAGSKWLIITGYELNKAYIAQKLCENKSRPQLQCHGKCHLKKQLQREENGGEDQSSQSGHQFREVVFDIAGNNFILHPLPVLITYPVHHILLYPPPCLPAVFHPPGVA